MSGRHRRNYHLKGAGVAGAGLAIVVVLAGTWLGYQRVADTGCTGALNLRVGAAAEIAPAVDRAAQQWVTDGANQDGTCVTVTVETTSPAVVAAAVAREQGASLTGLGVAPASVTVPDVWLPDSSTWLLRLQNEAPGFVPSDGRSVASSPVVMAVPAPVARTLGWPRRKLAWSDLLNTMTTSSSVRTGIVDPTRDAPGLAGLLALAGAAPRTPQGQAARVGALRALAAGKSGLRDELLERFPQSSDPADLAGALSAAPLSEQSVIAFNAKQPQIPLAALYLDPAPLALDYPFAVLSQQDRRKTAAAAVLHQVLDRPSFRDALATAGLRGSDGSIGANFAAPEGAAVPAASTSAQPPRGAAAAGLDGGAISRALGSWAAITLPGRVLSVFDVSGSMLKPVPTAGGLTRAQVTQRAAAQGLSLFDDKWAVGMWIFSTDMVGRQPWQEVVPITPLTSGRTALQAANSRIVPKKDGDTGLYDTALAAYQTVQKSWEAGRVNSVILFTDGKNENKGGLERDQLVARLKAINDPDRPVRMVIIGIGTEVDRGELREIADASGAGGVFIAEDPAKISEIFLEAIASRSGAAR